LIKIKETSGADNAFIESYIGQYRVLLCLICYAQGEKKIEQAKVFKFFQEAVLSGYMWRSYQK